MTTDPLTRRGLLAATGSALAASVAGCASIAPGNTVSSDPPDPSDTDDAAADRQAGTAYTEIYREIRDSVAAVRVRLPDNTSQGTAWLYDDQHLITNEHVVSDGESYSLWFRDDGWRDAEVVATDVYSDLAVLRPTELPGDADPIPMVQQDPPVGTRVLAIGNPFGFSGSVTAGIISGVDRTLPAPNNFSIADAVQTDAAVNPGNSGGPLVSLDGNVVGVINSGGGDNVGFAISAALTRRVVTSLLRTGTYDHPYMGIVLRDVTPPVVQANDLDVSRGVYVDDVVTGGPSDGVLDGSSGNRTVDGQELAVGGDVILSLDETPIPRSEALSTFLALETSPGDTIDVGIIRDGTRQTVQLTLGQRPPPN
jgi:serine protease Do